MSEDKSIRIIFGGKSANLEGLVSRGWSVHKYFEDILIDQDIYEIDTTQADKKVELLS